MSDQSSGLVAGNKQNEAGGASLRNRSRFPLSMSFFNTERFAEYVPFLTVEGVPNDRLTFTSAHDERTYTMKAPLMQSVLKKKDYFWVPMQAILPLNWEKFFTNPVIGEDVPDDVGTGVQNFWNKIESLFFLSLSALQGYWNEGSTISNAMLRDLFRFIVFFEYFYSGGSLLKCLGISGNAYCHVDYNNVRSTFDDFFDALISSIVSNFSVIQVNFGTSVYNVDCASVRDGYVYTTGAASTYNLSMREFLETLRDDLASFNVQGFTLAPGKTQSGVINDVVSIISTDFSFYQVVNSLGGVVAFPVHLNLARLWAYQLVCAHYFTNDHVDFVYSAELYRQYIREIATRNLSSGPMAVGSFSVNGLKYEYDALSAHVFSEVIDAFGTTSGIFSYGANSGAGNDYERSDNLAEAYAYITAIFHYKRSLRFMDYFSGSRTYPLAAVNDVSVSAAGGTVSILDLAQKRMTAKFLQSVNRVGRKIGAYVNELFDIVPKPDYHNPLFLAHTSDVVGNAEVENTAQGQLELANSVTSTMKSNASRYAFEFTPDRNCIVIGIQYYDIPRVYAKATERQNFFLDRFDMFNPYLQYIGDQEIYKGELGLDIPSMDPFAYTNRHMEYKQRFNQCAGGFTVPSTGLDNWIFISDNHRRRFTRNLTPSFIRSFNSEFDDFFTALSGWSNGTYFHFIVRYDNRLDASRPMAYAPSLA